MKKIKLNKGYLSLPESWEELSFKQKVFVFSKLRQVSNRELSPSVFRIQILFYLTGYRPQRTWLAYSLKLVFFYLRKLIVLSVTFLRVGRFRFKGYFDVWENIHKPRRKDREIVNLNLYSLSEQLDFAFSIDDNRTICWNKKFKHNPIPHIKVFGEIYHGRQFVNGIAPFTNITAREFSDCFDLLRAIASTSQIEIQESIIEKIISILYPKLENYKDNIVSDHADNIAHLDQGIKFGIYYWFTGVVDFYLQHPIYSLLFKRVHSEENEADKVSLGMNEVVLMLKKNGYCETDNVNDFFDAQIKMLKDSISEQLAYDVPIERISAATGLSQSEIKSLS